ncbi:MAG: 4Fe-4S binding protein [Mailhella sp.]|nr:4Fe-4S binding protein [Mailhella sp.]
MARLEIERIFYEDQPLSPGTDPDDAVFLQIDTSRCIGCDTCMRYCPTDAITGAPGKPHSIAFPEACILCGQCLAHCPQGAVYETQSGIAEIVRKLTDDNAVCIAIPSPSVRYTLGESFRMPVGSVTAGRMRSALRMLGFAHCWDAEFAADVCVLEESAEFTRKLDEKTDLPYFTCSCPGWQKYCETFYPELIAHLSTCRTPEAVAGILAKTYGAEQQGYDRKKIFAVAIVPCTAKKQESLRLAREEHAEGINAAIDTRELAWLMKKAGIDLPHLPEDGIDPLMGESSGSGTLFSTGGGEAEAVTRQVCSSLSGRSIEQPDFRSLRGMHGFKESRISVGGQEIRVAAVQGAKYFPDVLEKAASKNCPYQFIEFMACPGGCACGGGQPVMPSARELFDSEDELLFSFGKGLKRHG